MSSRIASRGFHVRYVVRIEAFSNRMTGRANGQGFPEELVEAVFLLLIPDNKDPFY